MNVAIPVAVGACRVSLTPPLTAMAWMKVGVPHQVMAVPEVYLMPGDALVEIEFATVCGLGPAHCFRPAPCTRAAGVGA